jgi:hypothetical protein
MRRQTLAFLVAMMALPACHLRSSRAADPLRPPSPRPNFVFFLADDKY